MTHAELAAKLLRDAATLFRNVGGTNDLSEDRIDQFASLYERAADLVESDPTGVVEETVATSR